jgi:membrane fusion protein, multidrug efflux system
VLDDQRLKGLLRPGMSAVPTVDTKVTVLAERATEARLASDVVLTNPKGGKGSCPAKSINFGWTILPRIAGLSKPTA